MGEVWPTVHIAELCLQLTAGSRPVNGDEHRTLRSQSCERALLTTGTLLYLCLPSTQYPLLVCFDVFGLNVYKFDKSVVDIQE